MHGNTLILDAFWVSNKKDFPTLLDPSTKEGKVFHDFYEGTARHLGWMDLVLLKSIIKKHNITHIILKNLIALGRIAQRTKVVRVCVSYENHRTIVRTVPEKEDFEHCKPVYTDAVIGGWDSTEEDNEVHVLSLIHI